MSAADAPPLNGIPDTQPRPVPPVEGLAPGNVGDWTAWGARTLESSSPSARADAEELMAAQLALPRSRLSLRGEDAMPAARALAYAAAIERRRVGEPVAYITGRQGFWNIELNVSPAVLIPRADTETLVEWVLQLVGDGVLCASPDEGDANLPTPVLKIADLGTGSGAIALALAQGLPGRARIFATDFSDAALQQARQNARALGLGAIEFREGNWFAALQRYRHETVDLIVSNPPYIAEDDPHLAELRFEPRFALTAGADGLDAVREIVSGARAHLRPGGWLMLEHGYDQGEAVRDLLRQAGFEQVETRRDFGGNERASAGRLP